MQWYLKVVKDNFANFSGRASRQEYWMFFLFNVLISIAVGVVDGLLGLGFLSLIYWLALLIPSIAVCARRLHDIDKSGWWMLIGLVPLIGGIWLIVLLCMSSNDGENRFGGLSTAAPE